MISIYACIRDMKHDLGLAVRHANGLTYHSARWRDILQGDSAVWVRAKASLLGGLDNRYGYILPHSCALKAH